MPEGDTVHRAARRLDEAFAGRVLVRSDFRVPRFATLDLAGRRTDSVIARGKHLLHRLEGVTVHSHLGMDGRWDVLGRGERPAVRAHRIRAVLDAGDVLAVGSLLAVLEVVETSAEHALLDRLGPDLLGDDWDAATAERRLVERLGRPIGLALLDQHVMAGVGNVYRNELCFLIGAMPTRPVGDLADPGRVIALARRLLTANAERVARVTTGVDRRGRRLWVYGRAGLPCLRCGTTILRGRLGETPTMEREISWCPSCQR